MYIAVRNFKCSIGFVRQGTILEDVKNIRLWRCLLSEDKVREIPTDEVELANFQTKLRKRFGIKYVPPKDTDDEGDSASVSAQTTETPDPPTSPEKSDTIKQPIDEAPKVTVNTVKPATKPAAARPPVKPAVK